MGLDTYAVKPRKVRGKYKSADPLDFADVGSLCGGMFSGNGNDGSFRGKAYSWLVEEVTGVSLYQEFIPPKTVAAMADALEAADPVVADDYDDFPALQRFFAVCRSRGYGLVGWW